MLLFWLHYFSITKCLFIFHCAGFTVTHPRAVLYAFFKISYLPELAIFTIKNPPAVHDALNILTLGLNYAGFKIVRERTSFLFVYLLAVYVVRLTLHSFISCVCFLIILNTTFCNTVGVSKAVNKIRAQLGADFFYFPSNLLRVCICCVLQLRSFTFQFPLTLKQLYVEAVSSDVI